MSQTTSKQSSTVRLTTTKQYDLLNRLQSISSVPSASPVVSSGYDYNLANQRTRLTQADGSYWVYSYDTLGQVISGKRYWGDGTPVAGQQHEYAYDDIGNMNFEPPPWNGTSRNEWLNGLGFQTGKLR